MNTWKKVTEVEDCVLTKPDGKFKNIHNNQQTNLQKIHSAKDVHMFKPLPA